MQTTIFMRRLVFLCLWLGAGSAMTYAQSLSGTLRGQVLDRSTQQPLEAVTVQLLTHASATPVLTDAEGQFRFESVPVGRHDLSFERTDYEPFAQNGVMVRSSKEVVLSIPMEVKLYQMDEVVLMPDQPRGTPRNQMAAVSALSFEIEETRKFAGGLDDPTRLAANFPGVVAAPFTSENFISIRGNSGRGLLYRVEGVDIPNPNHFARIG
ncbi:MAG: carboxypeptidase regulatory-like domain-containing protein, partial [Bacteroidetes bacterium]